MLAADVRLGREFSLAWEGMQNKVGSATPGSTLACSAADAGRHGRRVQAALTYTREQHFLHAFDVCARALPVDDACRIARHN
eukprot:4218909-Karenia_brevis.AAC.1